MASVLHTHEVLNQAPPISPYNVFDSDPAMREALEREVLAAGGQRGRGLDRLRDSGKLAGVAGGPRALRAL